MVPNRIKRPEARLLAEEEFRRFADLVANQAEPLTNRVVGEEAVVRAPGQVFVDGELWQARRADGGELVPGDHVRVEGVDGLELTVR